ncbi:MAG: putative DNA binding domain-containing protein [Bacteroidales bacterium]|nr:putative DNA binding domain-containing protein [Bacteroidales bacterium]
MQESHRIELKAIVTDSLEKEVVAFLNSREGGVIYIGVDDNGTIIGIENSDATQLQIKDRLRNNILPNCLGLFDIIGEEGDEKEIIKIIIASGPEKPYYLKKLGMSEKGCFIRIGTAAEPMTTRMIENQFARRTRNSIGKIRANQQKLKFEQLRIYYEESGKRLNAKFPENLGLLCEDGAFNYVAFLMSDINSISIKVAKYKGKNRVHLIENNEYGYCSIIKATKQVLDKIDLENKTKSRITSKERIDTRLWNAIALREAIINAIVHNDYSYEVPPKFEIFDDRIEITSAGSLPDLLSQEEFFEGFSIPRNQEMMRIFKDLELVEHLGSGVPRILEVYPKECFKFTENFLRMTFPNTWDLSEDEDAPQEEQVTREGQDTMQVTDQVTDQVKEQVREQVREQVKEQVNLMISIFHNEMSVLQLMTKLNLTGRRNFLQNYLQPALEAGLIEMTQPDSPNSPTQKYKLTEKGKTLQKQLKK